MKKSLIYSYFLGSNSPKGFVSHFDTSYDVTGGWRVAVLKGGAGTGKSGLMKKVVAAARKKGYNVQMIYCSSDPDSLDAVILPEKKKMILDGTAPHVVEPRLVGACENIVNLGQYWNADYLFQNADEIYALNSTCTKLHAQATRYISAADAFMRDTRRMAELFTNKQKVADYANRTAQKEFGKGKQEKGKCDVRLVSAVTPKGILFFEENFRGRTIVIDDEWGAASPIIIDILCKKANDCGFNTVLCPCSMSQDKAEHLIIPELELNFTTENRFHMVSMETEKRIHASRFADLNIQAQHKEKISFNRKAAFNLFNEASSAMHEAKAVHDRLEDIFIKSMDFSGVDEQIEKMIAFMLK